MRNLSISEFDRGGEMHEELPEVSCHRGIHETQMGQGIDDRGSAHRGTRRLGHEGPAIVARVV